MRQAILRSSKCLKQAVRKRPTMYLGSTDQRALHYLLRAVVESFLWQYREFHTPRLYENGAISQKDSGGALSLHPFEQTRRGSEHPPYAL